MERSYLRRKLWENFIKRSILLDSEHLTEEDRFEAEKQGASVVLKKVEKKEKEKE